MTTMNLDSLNACLHQIATRNMRPIDPVLILDTESGHFSIQSSQTDLDPQETLIADDLDTDGIPGWTDIPDPTGIYVADPWELMTFIQMVLHEMAPGAGTPRARMNEYRPRRKSRRHPQ
jgi:hypothetical protein